MGRNSTGAITVNQCLQLHVNIFVKHICNDVKSYSGRVSWQRGDLIDYRITNDAAGIYLVLDYMKGQTEKVNHKISICPKPSNLGKGINYYFICPATGHPCKILYLGYGSKHFKSRMAYQNRIYYPCQLSSRLNLYNDKFWSLERQLKTLYKKHPKSHYQGVPTRPQKRIKKLQEKRDYFDLKRWEFMPKSLMKFMR